MTTKNTTIDRKTITIQFGLAAVVVLAIAGGSWKAAIQYDRLNRNDCSFDDRLKIVETRIAALETSRHGWDIKLAEIQKDLKYLIVKVDEQGE